ncbi:carboxypeptidase-like regulatory domain-containing protein [Saccharicrinis sp. FJH62]|uniref:TonB-dependent receptor n=1 Tax=Saccharicrinis sp. FJH62 TaxID=3344657 RepID=UPI0035D4FD8A
MRIICTSLFVLFFSIITYGQGQVSGIVVDKDTKETLIGATVVLKGTTIGTVADMDGVFTLKAPRGKNTIMVSFVGYLSKEIPVEVTNKDIDLGVIGLQSDAIGIHEISVLANVAIDRKTPIAVTNIKPRQIELKLGTQEFPEILKSTPGVYVTKRGGGFGDADVRIRGFSSNNVAVMINGMPVNGMENDRVYWSNWAGLSDVTRTMQVQRGVGASKIAVPSVGGTINVLTKTTEARKGGNVFYNLGNNNYNKTGITLSTGLLENNWALTMMFSKTKGDGYVEGSPFNGYSYFFSLAKRLSDRQQLALTIFGASQWHARRYNYQPLSVLTKPDGLRFNEDWGYKNGQFFSNSTNFYSKPVAIINHYFNIDETTFLSSSLYGSWGSGGGGYTSSNGVNLSFNSEGHIDWDRIVQNNKQYAAQGTGGGIYFQNSYNNHQWYGLLSTLKKSLGDINLLSGVDLRYYKGSHWQQADDLLGTDFVIDKSNKAAVAFYNHPIRKGEKLSYNNDGEVAWEGLFLQGEYSRNRLSAFLSGTISNRSYRRIDYAQYFSDAEKARLAADPELRAKYESKLMDYMLSQDKTSILETEAYKVNQVTPWHSFIGYSLKTGANYNLNRKHNVFINGGYMERQPVMNTVFQNNRNLFNDGAVNEKVLSTEIGYGFRSQYFSSHLNIYYTFWKNKTRTGNVTDPTNPDERLFYNIEGINARHEGIELDFNAKPTEKVEINGMISVGDWIWANNVDSVKIFKDQTLVYTIPKMYLNGIHVADAAQTTAALGVNVEVLSGLKVGVDMNYAARLFANFNLNARTMPEDEGVDVEKVPAYMLFDLNAFYDFKIGNLNASLHGNMNNALNTTYIADAYEGQGYYFGFGRTFSFGLKVRF